MAKNDSGGVRKSLSNLMKTVFNGYNSDDRNNPQILLETGQVGEQWSLPAGVEDQGKTTLSVPGSAERDRLYLKSLPNGRIERYKIFEEMAVDSSISTIIDIHIAHAFSSDLKTGKSITLTPTADADIEYIKKLQVEVIDPINKSIMNWARVACIFGVNYVRIHGDQGIGIKAWEWNYYTLPSNIVEYERSGGLAGFTSENLKRKNTGSEIELAEPWTLISMKLPNWSPSLFKEPVRFTAEPFSLFDDTYTRSPIETQNYGSSLLESCYEPWCRLCESLNSLLASRNNASHIDRFVGVDTDGLDPAKAAEYLNILTSELKKDKEKASRKAQRNGFVPTVWNYVFPSPKGAVNIDTQTIDPNIQHIEDIMFHFKRMCGAAGIEPSMVGFSDVLSGGLGDGGFLRTSIQSALKAHILRSAAADMCQRSIDIHTAFRDGKVWPAESRPYTITFNSMSTAIAIEEESAREARANYATVVATLLDAIEQGAMKDSNTFKKMMYENELGIEPEIAEKIISELAVKIAGNSNMMESIGISRELQNERYIKDVMLDVLINGSESDKNE